MSSFCLTNTIDNFSNLGNKYYHNLNQNKTQVIMRPRLPLRFDFNEIEMVKMNPKSPEVQSLLRHYRKTNANNLYRVKRTKYSVINTILLYTLSFILIVSCVNSMQKILGTIQGDRTLTQKDKLLFRLSFVILFMIVLFIFCFIALSMFELYRNYDIFPTFTINNFKYKNIRGQDGNRYFVRYVILCFIFIAMLVAIAEIFNLFYMRPNKLSVLFLFIPVVMCFVMFINLYFFYTQGTT